jgi:hypothetical protein
LLLLMLQAVQVLVQGLLLKECPGMQPAAAARQEQHCHRHYCWAPHRATAAAGAAGAAAAAGSVAGVLLPHLLLLLLQPHHLGAALTAAC